jgi:hypothetical protein
MVVNLNVDPLAVRQLATEYARLIDAKGLRAVAGLFVPDVRVGDAVGRKARYEAFRSNHGRSGRFRRTIHLVSGHSIDLDAQDSDRATGTVYCRAEHEVGDLRVIVVIQYWDTYSRREGQWLFEDRLIQTLYVADALERPNGAAIKHVVTNTGAATTATLPRRGPAGHRSARRRASTRTSAATRRSSLPGAPARPGHRRRQ